MNRFVRARNGEATVKRGCKGFTLIELMIVVFVGIILLTLLYATYAKQQEVFSAQDKVAEMQQNIRGVMLLISREIRSAGFDPKASAGADFEEYASPGAPAMRAGRVKFTLDANESGILHDGVAGDQPERIELGLSPVDDANGDGLADGVDGNGVKNVLSFRRETDDGVDDTDDTNLTWIAVAPNIQALEFQYIDSDGNVTATPADVRAVNVSLLVRASRPDPGRSSFVNDFTYTPASGVPWDLNPALAGNGAGDKYRRRLLITTIQCRNMGL